MISGGGECDGHTMGSLGGVGWGGGGGGGTVWLMYMRARAPPVAVCLVYKWRENLLVSRAVRPHGLVLVPACREDRHIF